MKKHLLLFTVFCFFTITVYSQPKPGYYEPAIGKMNDALRTTLKSIITKGHSPLTYKELWLVYKDTDIKPSTGKIWDMYSNCSFTHDKDQDRGSGGTNECQFYNREHSIPQSWFEKADPMVADAFHVYPTDKKVNSERSDYLFGEVSSPSYISGNGSKVGSSNFAGYTGTVFEPIDEYKGDFARTYFYMATRYADQCNSWGHGVFGAQNSGLTTYAVNLFIKWHRQDPVSEKELNRNNAVEKHQKNRNPFIDYPELAEFIWGDKKGMAWNISSGIDESIINFIIVQNPVQYNISIKTNETNLEYAIFNLSGQILQSGSIMGNADIPVSEFPNGLYLLQLNTEGKKSIEKIMINK